MAAYGAQPFTLQLRYTGEYPISGHTAIAIERNGDFFEIAAQGNTDPVVVIAVDLIEPCKVPKWHSFVETGSVVVVDNDTDHVEIKHGMYKPFVVKTMLRKPNDSYTAWPGRERGLDEEWFFVNTGILTIGSNMVLLNGNNPDKQQTASFEVALSKSFYGKATNDIYNEIKKVTTMIINLEDLYSVDTTNATRKNAVKFAMSIKRRMQDLIDYDAKTEIVLPLTNIDSGALVGIDFRFFSDAYKNPSNFEMEANAFLKGFKYAELLDSVQDNEINPRTSLTATRLTDLSTGYHVILPGSDQYTVNGLVEALKLSSDDADTIASELKKPELDLPNGVGLLLNQKTNLKTIIRELKRIKTSFLDALQTRAVDEKADFDNNSQAKADDTANAIRYYNNVIRVYNLRDENENKAKKELDRVKESIKLAAIPVSTPSTTDTAALQAAQKAYNNALASKDTIYADADALITALINDIDLDTAINAYITTRQTEIPKVKANVATIQTKFTETAVKTYDALTRANTVKTIKAWNIDITGRIYTGLNKIRVTATFKDRLLDINEDLNKFKEGFTKNDAEIDRIEKKANDIFKDPEETDKINKLATCLTELDTVKLNLSELRIDTATKNDGVVTEVKALKIHVADLVTRHADITKKAQQSKEAIDVLIIGVQSGSDGTEIVQYQKEVGNMLAQARTVVDNIEASNQRMAMVSPINKNMQKHKTTITDMVIAARKKRQTIESKQEDIKDNTNLAEAKQLRDNVETEYNALKNNESTLTTLEAYFDTAQQNAIKEAVKKLKKDIKAKFDTIRVLYNNLSNKQTAIVKDDLENSANTDIQTRRDVIDTLISNIYDLDELVEKANKKSAATNDNDTLIELQSKCTKNLKTAKDDAEKVEVLLLQIQAADFLVFKTFETDIKSLREKIDAEQMPVPEVEAVADAKTAVETAFNTLETTNAAYKKLITTALTSDVPRETDLTAIKNKFDDIKDTLIKDTKDVFNLFKNEVASAGLNAVSQKQKIQENYKNIQDEYKKYHIDDLYTTAADVQSWGDENLKDAAFALKISLDSFSAMSEIAKSVVQFEVPHQEISKFCFRNSRENHVFTGNTFSKLGELARNGLKIVKRANGA